MTTDAPRVGDPGFHLRGNFAPVEREVTAHDLPVTGSLPAQLRGVPRAGRRERAVCVRVW